MTSAICKFENKLIGFSTNFNVLFSVDLSDGEMRILDSLPSEDLFEKNLVGSVNLYGDRLLLVPFNAKKVWIYNLKTAEFTPVSLEYGSRRLKFWNSFVFNDKLYMIPRLYPAFVIIDLKTYEVTEKSEMVLPPSTGNEGTGYFCSDYVIEGDEIVLASCSSNSMLKFNMSSEKYKWIKVGGNNNRYSAVAKVDGDYWLAPLKDTPVVKYSDGKAFEYNIPNDFKNEYNFLGIVNNGSLIIPGMKDRSLIIDPETSELSIRNEDSGYTFYGWVDKNTLVSATKNGKLIITDSLSSAQMVIEEEKMDIIGYIENTYYSKCIMNNSLMKENKVLDLKLYLKMITKEK